MKKTKRKVGKCPKGRTMALHRLKMKLGKDLEIVKAKPQPVMDKQASERDSCRMCDDTGVCQNCFGRNKPKPTERVSDEDFVRVCEFLYKEGYLDSDWYAEQPTALESYQRQRK